MVEFEKVIDGVVKYINTEMVSKMNNVQEFVVRVLAGRVINNAETIKKTLVNNGYIRTFGIINDDGLVDVEGLSADIKRELTKMEQVTFTLPMFGKLTFVPSDIDVITGMIHGEEQGYDNN